ncbi:MAG: TetR family transcriptional regulator [Desulfobacter sp.]|nr:TetR family transcriptional regulator [Desulfobacter sp.]WDP84057.1 MAG: TetR family transcriptional regulator [Desulfobacter sp.]
MRNTTKENRSFIEIHRRKQILDIAVDMISRNGYQQTTMAAIAKEAGFSKGVIFYYFKNKEDLISQTGLTLLEELRSFTIGQMKKQAPGKGQLNAYVKAYFDFIRKNQKKFSILMEVGFNLNTMSQHSLFGSQEYAECRRRLDKLIQMEGMPKGEGQALSAVIQGMLDGVGIQWIADKSAVDLDACQSLIVEMVGRYMASDNMPE